MKKNKLVFVCLTAIAAGLVIAGIGFLFGGRVYGLSLGRKGVIVNSNQNVKTLNYVEEEKDLASFKNLDAELSFADVEIQKSDHFGIKYRLQEDRLVTDTMDGDTLVLKQEDGIHNITLFSMGSAGTDSDGNEYIIVYVPETVFGTVSISNDAGNIDIDAITAKNLLVKDSFGNLTIGTADAEKYDLDLDSGDISIENMNGNTCTVRTSFGKIKMEETSLTGRFECNADSGDVDLGNMTADEISVAARFGVVTGGAVTVRNMDTTLDSGDLTIDELSADYADVSSKFGSIELGLKETVDAYAIEADTDFGTIVINGTENGQNYNESASSDSERRLVLSADSGDVRVNDAK